MPLLTFHPDDPDWWGTDPLIRMRADNAFVSVEYGAVNGLRKATGRLRLVTDHGLLLEVVKDDGTGEATWIVRERVVAVWCHFVVDDAPSTK